LRVGSLTVCSWKNEIQLDREIPAMCRNVGVPGEVMSIEIFKNKGVRGVWEKFRGKRCKIGY